jgi:hypothetical protein
MASSTKTSTALTSSCNSNRMFTSHVASPSPSPLAPTPHSPAPTIATAPPIFRTLGNDQQMSMTVEFAVRVQRSNQLPENTRRSYESKWLQWQEYCNCQYAGVGDIHLAGSNVEILILRVSSTLWACIKNGSTCLTTIHIQRPKCFHRFPNQRTPWVRTPFARIAQQSGGCTRITRWQNSPVSNGRRFGRRHSTFY